MNKHGVYTVQQIADFLQVSTKTVYKLIHDGEIAAIWVRGQIRITEHSLFRYLKEGINE